MSMRWAAPGGGCAAGASSAQQSASAAMIVRTRMRPFPSVRNLATLADFGAAANEPTGAFRAFSV